MMLRITKRKISYIKAGKTVIHIHPPSEDSVTFKIRGRSGEGSVIYQEKIANKINHFHLRMETKQQGSFLIHY
jgi:hypothetical protein